MKKIWMLKTLILGASLAVLSACNEKIAPELADPATVTDDGTGGSTTTTGGSGGGGGGSTSSSNSFRLELDTTPSGVSPSLLGYSLHKANEAGSSSCIVNDITDVPSSLDSTRDITCYVEAEEYALYFNGFGMIATSDAGTCNYILTTPASYYRFQPGVSTRMDGNPRQVVKFECEDSALDNFPATVVTGFGTNASSYDNVTELCGKYFNIDEDGTPVASIDFASLNLSATAAPVSVEDEADLCSFNYTLSDETEVKCDEGKIKIHTVSLRGVDSATDPTVGIDTLVVTPDDPRTLNCGGKVRNCMSGAAPEIIPAEDFAIGYNNMVTQMPAEGGTSSVLKVAPSLDRYTNFYLSNFLRQCSGLPNFNQSATMVNFNTLAVSFNPDVMEDYVRLGTTLPGTQEKDPNLSQMDIIILADDPFRAGIPTATISAGTAAWNVTKMKTQPFHTYTCLDSAFDAKARIRVAVREWNRNYSPASQEFRYISDAFNNTLGTARMDAGSGQSNPYLLYDEYNDKLDWDDWLTFENSATNSCTLVNMDSTVYPLRSPLWFPGELE